MALAHMSNLSLQIAYILMEIEKENKRAERGTAKAEAVLQQKYQKVLDVERNRQIQQFAEKDKIIEGLQTKLKGELFRLQQDNQENNRIIKQKDNISSMTIVSELALSVNSPRTVTRCS